MNRSALPLLVALTLSACSNESADEDQSNATACKGGCVSWTQEFGADSLTSPIARTLTVGPKGTFAIGGQTSGDKDQFGCGAVQTSDHAAFIARFTSTGKCLWHKEIVPTGQPAFSSRARTDGVAIDDQGRVTIAATVNYTVDLGGGALAPVGSDPDAAELLIAQYDSEGKFRWAKRFGAKATGGGNPRIAPRGLRVAPDGDVVVIGVHAWPASIGATKLPESGSAFVARLSSEGEVRWAKEAGSEIALWDVAVSENSVVVTGEVGGYMIVGGEGPHQVFGKTVEVPKGADANLVVASFSPTGKVSWVRGFDGMQPHVTPSPGADARSVAIDVDGSVVVGGTLSGRVAFAETELAPPENAGFASYIARFSPKGEPVSAQAWPERGDVKLSFDGHEIHAVSGSEVGGLFVGELDEGGVADEITEKGAHARVEGVAATRSGVLLVLMNVGVKGGKAFGHTFHRGQAAFLYRP